MFKKTRQPQHFEINQQQVAAIIGEDFVFTGNLTGKAVIRIDGEVKGDVTVDGGVILGEKGAITGNVKTASAIVYGTISGDVKAIHLEIKKTGKIDGDIKTETLEIELGAHYNGKLEMKQQVVKEG